MAGFDHQIKAVACIQKHVESRALVEVGEFRLGNLEEGLIDGTLAFVATALLGWV